MGNELRVKRSGFVVKIDDGYCEWEFGFTVGGHASIDKFVRAIEKEFETKRDYEKRLIKDE